MTSYQISIQKGNLILVWKLLTATSFYFASANSPIIVLFIYLFISHMQQVVFWTIWNILYLGGGGGCIVCLFVFSQIKVTCHWIDWVQPSRQLCGPVFIINFQVPACWWPKGEKLSFTSSLGICSKNQLLCISIDFSELTMHHSFVGHTSTHWSMSLICYQTKRS